VTHYFSVIDNNNDQRQLRVRPNTVGDAYISLILYIDQKWKNSALVVRIILEDVPRDHVDCHRRFLVITDIKYIEGGSSLSWKPFASKEVKATFSVNEVIQETAIAVGEGAVKSKTLTL
jgi:hypothetical protein